VLTRLVDAGEGLASFPRLGRVVGEYTQYRELVVDKYRVMYLLQGSTVTVLSIWHGAMDIEPKLRKLLGQED
jgi:plasmid stabilization system protein ParE